MPKTIKPPHADSEMDRQILVHINIWKKKYPRTANKAFKSAPAIPALYTKEREHWVGGIATLVRHHIKYNQIVSVLILCGCRFKSLLSRSSSNKIRNSTKTKQQKKKRQSTSTMRPLNALQWRDQNSLISRMYVMHCVSNPWTRLGPWTRKNKQESIDKNHNNNNSRLNRETLRRISRRLREKSEVQIWVKD